MSVAILFQDEHLLVVAKPAGVLSVADARSETPSVPALLERQGLRAYPAHRLDRDVSGALLLGRTSALCDELQQLFRARALRKIYWGLAAGWLEPRAGKLTFPILEERSGARVSARGQPARTEYRTLRRLHGVSELELDLVTGRRNQIRVHLAHAGHPLIGERKYARGRDAVLALRSRRVALHAWRLSFAHPRGGAAIEVEAPLPADLYELLRRAGG